MPADPIYLDHNATAPILPAVADAMREAALRYPGNPASQHEAGRQARRALEEARERIGQLLGAQTGGMEADQIIFTSGGTEANNLALYGLLACSATYSQPSSAENSGLADVAAGSRSRFASLVVSAIEHPSVLRTAEAFAAAGLAEVRRLGVDSRGVVLLEQLDSLLLPTTRVASVMLASNETGVLQPIAEVAAVCRRQGVLIHTDATQAVGKTPVDFRAIEVDALTAAAHKFHGPIGVGVLIVRHGVRLEPLFRGGFQQAGWRPGTESVPLAVGMLQALELWHSEADDRRQRMMALRDRLEQAMLAGYPQAVIVGQEAERLPHTSNVAFVGVDRQALVMALDLAGVACSSGSACASGSSEPSPALRAMGLAEEVISSSIRFSLGATTTSAQIEEAARRILNVCNRLRRER